MLLPSPCPSAPHGIPTSQLPQAEPYRARAARGQSWKLGRSRQQSVLVSALQRNGTSCTCIAIFAEDMRSGLFGSRPPTKGLNATLHTPMQMSRKRKLLLGTPPLPPLRSTKNASDFDNPLNHPKSTLCLIPNGTGTYHSPFLWPLTCEERSPPCNGRLLLIEPRGLPLPDGNPGLGRLWLNAARILHSWETPFGAPS